MMVKLFKINISYFEKIKFKNFKEVDLRMRAEMRDGNQRSCSEETVGKSTCAKRQPSKRWIRPPKRWFVLLICAMLAFLSHHIKIIFLKKNY